MSNSEENMDIPQDIPQEELPAASELEPVTEPEAVLEPEVADKAGPDILLGQERALELISFVVVNLVDNPEDVTIDLVRRQGRDIYQVRVNPEDLGKVIGKGGQTARALRVLLMSFSARTDQRIGLEIVE